MQLIDTHTHLTDKAYHGRLNDVLERSRQAGVDQWVTIGTDLTDSVAVVELCAKYENMRGSVGVHPHEASKQKAGYIDKLYDLVGCKKVCAIGEIGLDYHYDFSDRTSQQRVFSEQLEVATETSLPVVIHCREAMDDSLAILDEWNRPDVPVVFHCFDGDLVQAESVLDRGFWLSFTGTVTFKKAVQIQEVARCVPLEHVMLETDCPYLSPEPQRKVRPNEPALMVHIAEKLAHLRDMPVEEIAEVTRRNSRSFFKLDCDYLSRKSKEEGTQ